MRSIAWNGGRLRRVMSYLDAAARVTQIRTMFEQVAQPAGTQSSSGFGQALQQASASQAATAAQSTGAVAPTGETAGLRALDAARSQLGVTEQPPGSNDGPDIARYRGAVAGAYAGAPWCAYFVSWCAAQAGAPIGDGGTGLGSVEAVAAWAQRTGRFTDAARAGRADPLRRPPHRHRRVGQRRRHAEHHRGQHLRRRPPPHPRRVRSHRLRAAVARPGAPGAGAAAAASQAPSQAPWWTATAARCSYDVPGTEPGMRWRWRTSRS